MGERGAAVRLALGMVVFGSATPTSKLVVEAWPPFVAALLRVGLGALVLLPFTLPRLGCVRAMGRADWLRTAAIALFGMFGFTILLLYGMRSAPGVVGAIVMSTTPAVTALGATLFLGEVLNARRGAAIGLAVVGVAVLQIDPRAAGLGGSDAELWLGALLVFGAVLCEAAYTLLGKRTTRDVDPLVVALLGAALAIPLFLPFAWWQWERVDWPAATAADWVALAWYGGGTLALGSWLWYSGLPHAPGAVAAGFMGLMPCSALGLSYLLLGEPFRWIHLLGFGIVLAGVLLISFEHARSAEDD